MLQQTTDAGIVTSEKLDIKDEFARLGRRALIVYCLLVVGEQVAIFGGVGQSGQKIEFWREWDLNCSR